MAGAADILFGGGAPTTDPNAPAPPSNADILFAPAPAPTTAAATPAPGAAAPAPTAPSGQDQYLAPAWLHDPANALVGGMGTGLGAVASSVNRLLGSPLTLSGAPPADVKAAMEANPGFAATGRVVGNVVGTAPLLGGAGTLLRAVPGVAALGDLGVATIGRVPFLTPALSGAVQGGVVNALTSPDDMATAFKQGLGPGAILGGATGILGGIGRAVANVGIPQGGNAARIAQLADQYDVPLLRAQTSTLGGRAAKMVSMYGSANVEDAVANQQAALTKAYMTHMVGAPADAADVTPTSMAANAQRIGNKIENAAGRINISGNDPDLLNDMGRIETNSLTSGAGSPQANTASTLHNRIINIMSNNNGTMPGPEFQKFIARGGELDNAIGSSNQDVSNTAQQIKDALLDSARRTGSADAVQDLQEARGQWKGLKTVEPLAAKSTDGTISPALLPQAIRTSYGNAAISQGRAGAAGDFHDLATAIKPLGTSGTAEHMAALGIMGGVGGVAGSLLGGAPMAALGAGLSTAGTMGAARLAGRYLSTNVANQLLRQAPSALAVNPLVVGGVPAWQQWQQQ